MATTHSSPSTIPRITSKTLSQTLLQHASTSPNLDAKVAPNHIAIIDVRDDDHIGGHILHSTHVPSSQLDHRIPALVRSLKDKDIVVFHCALSQVRGPKAALQYLKARERLLGSAIGEAMKKDKAEELERGKAGEEGEWEDVDEKDGGERKEQKVYVLERGFVGWQEEFGEDTRLTEGYRKEIWKEGYWM